MTYEPPTGHYVTAVVDGAFRMMEEREARHRGLYPPKITRPGRSESHQRAIDQVAILFPYLTVAERSDWYKRLDCDLAELTIHMPERDSAHPEPNQKETP